VAISGADDAAFARAARSLFPRAALAAA